jgi:hypothetical protein
VGGNETVCGFEPEATDEFLEALGGAGELLGGRNVSEAT